MMVTAIERRLRRADPTISLLEPSPGIPWSYHQFLGALKRTCGLVGLHPKSGYWGPLPPENWGPAAGEAQDWSPDQGVHEYTKLPSEETGLWEGHSFTFGGLRW